MPAEAGKEAKKNARHALLCAGRCCARVVAVRGSPDLLCAGLPTPHALLCAGRCCARVVAVRGSPDPAQADHMEAAISVRRSRIRRSPSLSRLGRKPHAIVSSRSDVCLPHRARHRPRRRCGLGEMPINGCPTARPPEVRGPCTWGRPIGQRQSQTADRADRQETASAQPVSFAVHEFRSPCWIATTTAMMSCRLAAANDAARAARSVCC
jgi:hypothetical protein